jgi:hypothetical protein
VLDYGKSLTLGIFRSVQWLVPWLVPTSTSSSISLSKGRTIRKVMGEGGQNKNKNRAGETEKKFEHEKSLKKKIRAETFQSGKIISCARVATKFGK